MADVQTNETKQILVALGRLEENFKNTNAKIDDLSKVSTLVVQTEQSAKSAHNRIDDIKVDFDKKLQDQKEDYEEKIKDQKERHVGKRSKKFKLFYTPEVQNLIKTYLDERGEDDFPQLFVRVYKTGERMAVSSDAFNYWCEQFGQLLSAKEGRKIHVNPHCFRHSRLENLSRDGVPVEKLKSLAHHEDISTTASYLADREEDDIAEIFGMDPSELEVSISVKESIPGSLFF